MALKKALSTSIPKRVERNTVAKLNRQVPARPGALPPRPVANLNRITKRIEKRDAVRKSITKTQPSRPRPVVRPAAPPRRVLPPAPAPVGLKSRSRRPAVATTTSHHAATRSATRSVGRARPPAAAATAATAGFLALNAAAAHADISTETGTLQRSLAELQERSAFETLQGDLQDLDQLLTRISELLESARAQGYRYQGDLEGEIYQALGDWETARDRLYSAIDQSRESFQDQLRGLDSQVKRLNANLYSVKAAEPHLRATSGRVNQLLGELARVEDRLEDQYNDIETSAYQINTRLTQIHWTLEQMEGAAFKLENGEDLVMAVATRWDKAGKDDPEGVLYLTNRRLLFERKEKIAIKKVLFITTASELVQEVLIDQPLVELSGFKAENRGLFGNQDFLQVQFKDGKFGVVDFHINGQDSRAWVELLNRAQSGTIEKERAGGGTGITARDLARPLTQADIMAIQSEVNGLQDETMLQELQTELADLENEMRGLERKLAEVRAQGYAIEKDLEADVQVLAVQWDRVKQNADTTISNQTRLLSGQMESIQSNLARLVGMSGDLQAARPIYLQLKSALASLHAQVEAAEETVFAQYDDYADEVTSLAAHFDWIAWMLGALATASFRLLATESGVAAVEAEYLRPGLDPENGVLFLTDQRLLWEDRVGTYELKVNVPVAEVLEVASVAGSEDQEMLEFKLGARGPAPSVSFRPAMPVANDWQIMVGRARSGGYTQDRAISLSEAELERIRSAPRQCSNCGAVFSQPVLRGQTEMTCEYCGVVTGI